MKAIREIVKGKKFNGKIYGKAGSYSIYLNNNKVEISDTQASEYIQYLRELEDVKSSFPMVLNSRKCQEVAVEEGIEKEFVEPTLEQLKAKRDLFVVEELKKEKDGISATCQIAYYKNAIVAVYAENSLGKEIFVDNEDDFTEFISQFK